MVEHEHVAILNPELVEQDLPDQAAPIPGIVVPVGVGEDALGIDRRELEVMVGLAGSSPTRTSPISAAQARQRRSTSFASLDRRPVVERREPCRSQVLQHLDLGREGRQQQRLGESILGAEGASRLVVLRTRLRFRLRDTGRLSMSGRSFRR